ncbi:MAG TPA: glycoside hydrolase family 2 protein [Bacteroidales bacterium]|nr:glycoside hydrolase family 2 protein [Bacteroidales bacterium]
MMRFQCYAYFILILLLSGCSTRNEALLLQLKLTDNWEFKSSAEPRWHNADLPGDILSHVSKIKGFGNRWLLDGSKLRDILNASWEYRNIFNVSESLLSKDSINISLPKLHGPARVYINDSLLCRKLINEVGCDHSCKRILKKGKNELRIVFDPLYFTQSQDSSYFNSKEEVVSSLIRAIDKLPFKNVPDIPGLIDAPCITAWSIAKIEDVYFYPLTVSDKSAQYNAEINIMASEETEMNLEISVDDRSIIKLYELKLKPGINKQIVSFSIANPKLWWTSGLGEQYLYKATFRLFSSRQLVHEVSFPLGARKLEIVYDSDSINQQLKFLLNGKPVFLKGGIVDIPHNLDPSQIETSYQKIADQVKAANINLIRLLHPDFYRADLFYKLCSENGILVWQDFPVSEASTTRRFNYAWEQSMKYLRNMPCCAVYMGRAEDACDNSNNGPVSTAEVFIKKELPLMIKKYDHRTFYWTMQVNKDLCSKESVNGNIDACMAQSLGLCSIAGEPCLSYISSSSLLDFGRTLGIPVSEIHAKMNSLRYMDSVLSVNSVFAQNIQQISKSYPNPGNIASALYETQLYQACQIKQYIESYRLKNENCIGFTNWRIYDSTPASLGNSIDFWGRTKPAYYSLRDSYAANTLIAQADVDMINIYAINDELKDLDAILLCKMIDFYGNTYFVKQIPVTVMANSKALLLSLSKSDLLKGLSSRKIALLLQLNQPGRTNAQNILYFAEPKFLELPKTNIRVDINQVNLGYNIILKSNVFVKSLYLETDRPEARFSDNNIDLLPGKRYKIFVSYQGSHDELTKNLVIHSINNLR